MHPRSHKHQDLKAMMDYVNPDFKAHKIHDVDLLKPRPKSPRVIHSPDMATTPTKRSERTPLVWTTN